MNRDVAVLIVAAGCWVGFAYKLRHLRQRAAGPGGPALRALVVLLGTLAASLMLGAPALGRAVDSSTGLPGIMRLAANVVSLFTCLALREWMLHLSRPADAAARIAVHRRLLAPVAVVMVILYVVDHPPVTPDQEFVGLHSYAYLLYVLSTAGPVVFLFWDYARVVEPPMMRLGLRLAAAGSGLGLSGVVGVLVYKVAGDLQLHLPGEASITKPVYSVGSVMFVTGIVLPAVGPRIGLEALWWRVARQRAARRMRRLWRAVTTACPGVVLDRELLAASPYGDRLLVERFPVEIYDGWLELRHYLDEADIALVDRFAASGRSRHRPARVAAGYLALAIERKVGGAGPVQTAPVVGHFTSPTGSTLLGDVRFLCEVSRQLRSGAVRQMVAATRGTAGASEPGVP